MNNMYFLNVLVMMIYKKYRFNGQFHNCQSWSFTGPTAVIHFYNIMSSDNIMKTLYETLRYLSINYWKLLMILRGMLLIRGINKTCRCKYFVILFSCCIFGPGAFIYNKDLNWIKLKNKAILVNRTANANHVPDLAATDVPS